jgi:WD40 repeat protein
MLTSPRLAGTVLLVLTLAAFLNSQEPRRVDAQGDPLPPGAILRFGTSRLRTTSPILAVVFAPDGNVFATSDRGQICIWDLASQRQIRKLRIRKEPFPPGFVDFVKGGRELICAGSSEVEFWDVATGKLLRSFPLHLERAPKLYLGYCLAVGADEKSLITCDLGERIRIWDLESGEELRRFTTRGTEVVVSKDRKTLAAADRDGTIELWDLETGKRHNTMLQDDPLIYQLAFSPDGRTIGVSGQGTIRIWDLATGRQVLRLRTSTNTRGENGFVFLPDGKTIMTGGPHEGAVRFWNVATGEKVRTIDNDTWPAAFTVFSPNGKLMTCDFMNENTPLFRETATGKLLNPPTGHLAAIVSVVPLPGDTEVLTVGIDNTIKRWSLRSGEELDSRRMSDPFEVSGLGEPNMLVSSGRVVVTTADIQMIDLESGEELWRLENPNCSYIMAASPDMSVLAVGAVVEGVLNLYDGSSGKLRKRLVDPPWNPEDRDLMVCSMVFSLDGSMLAVRNQREIQLWNVASSRLVHRLLPKTQTGSDIAFSPDGRGLAIAEGTGISLWEVASGKQRLFVDAGRADSEGVWSIFFSPDDRFLIGLHGDAATFWDTFTGKVCGSVRCDGGISTIAFTSDGRKMITGSYDTTALVWDVADLHLPRSPR